MDEPLKKALNQPDIDDILLSAIEHADMTMRKYIWRGFKPKSAHLDRELIVGDKTAKDFVNEALKRLCDGTRSFNSKSGLLDNLNSITDSLIWCDKKSSDRIGIVDFAHQPDESGDWNDPLANKASPEASADEMLIQNEQCEAQTKCFTMIKASFDGDKETQDYLDVLSLGYFETDEISTLTDIPVAKIYEIRRKLKKFVPRLFGVSNFAELERKIANPK